MANYYLVHSGKSVMDGAPVGSGRYRLGSGLRPFQRDKSRITQKKEGYNISAKRVKKNMNNMTDQELRTALNRINMQREIEQANPPITKRGENALKRYTAILGAGVAAVAISKKVGIDNIIKTIAWLPYKVV